MSKHVSEAVLIFFFYSVMGWIWETIYCSLKTKKLVRRGFLYGPYCPIYGFGIFLILYLVRPIQGGVAELFLYSTLAVTLLEYFTGFMLEKLFHTTWWNYHYMPLNIHGRVAVPVSVFWGMCCVIVTKFVHPALEGWTERLYDQYGLWLPAAIALLMGADAVKSVTNMVIFKNILEQTEDLLMDLKILASQKKEKLLTKKQELFADVRTRLSKKLPPLTPFAVRMLKAYPGIRMKNMAYFAELKEALLDKIYKR